MCVCLLNVLHRVACVYVGVLYIGMCVFESMKYVLSCVLFVSSAVCLPCVSVVAGFVYVHSKLNPHFAPRLVPALSGSPTTPW